MTITDKLTFSKSALNKYVKKIQENKEMGIETEDNLNPYFKKLMEDFFDREEFKVESFARDESGEDKPDIIVYMDELEILKIEAKPLDNPIDNHLKFGTSDRLYGQVFRYRGREEGDMPLMITDFKKIWVVDKDSPNTLDMDHKVYKKFEIIDDRNTIWKISDGAIKNLAQSLTYLCKDTIFSINRISSLIRHLVKYAQLLKEKIIQVIEDPVNNAERYMRDYLMRIREDLLDTIFSADKKKKAQEFADIFSQTMVYASFIAWMKYCKDKFEEKEKNGTEIDEKFSPEKDFIIETTSRYLPEGTFARQIFSEMWINITDDIKNEILKKIEKIFQSTKFKKISKNAETLMITFYAKFLNQYDPKTTTERGVVYTPKPVINFIVRGIDHFLKKEDLFNKDKGIVAEDISFLDPASGTMGFPCEIIREAKKYFKKEYENQPGRIIPKFNNWIKQNFLQNVYAFEILMAPYFLGHLRVNMVINEEGGNFNPEEDRAKLFLFNTLMDTPLTTFNFHTLSIQKEIKEALNIRNAKKLLIILGNPPYSKGSQNNFKWINEKINYKKSDFSKMEKRELKRIKIKEKIVDGVKEIKKSKNDYVWDLQKEGTKPITNVQGLHNDYVKFIRFAQHKIKQNGYGIVGYIAENSFIYKMLFRGMRSSLMRDFDKIYIIDLHGNQLENVEIPEDLRKAGVTVDENVFGNDTQVGVAIIFLIRKQDHSDDDCEINYVDKWGKEDDKLIELEKSISDLNFQEVSKNDDFLFRTQSEFPLKDRYMNFTYLYDIFKENGSSSGITTGNNPLYSNADLEQLKENLEKHFEMDEHQEEFQKIKKWNFGGFDIRYLYYDPPSLVRDRYEIMQYLLNPNNDNFTLIINRQQPSGNYSSVFISEIIFYVKCFGSGGVAYAFPLKINESDEPNDFSNPKPAIHSNIRGKFRDNLAFGNEISDKQIFYYIYSVLYSPLYRQRYNYGLKKDYPRIPFPESKALFLNMVELGKRLTDLHLFRANNINSSHFRMSRSTDYKIYNIKENESYDPETKKIYFKKRTKTQIRNEKEGDSLDEITWIGNITKKMWDFEIGEKQQLKWWLYSRRYSEENKKNTIPRALLDNELEYFLKLCDVIKKTIELRPKLDDIYKKIDVI